MIAAMCREMQAYKDHFGPLPIRTIFIGGGTPNSLSPEALTQLLQTANDCFSIAPEIEKTIEINPESLRHSTLDILQKFHFNRLSLGVQSFVKTELNALGRSHNSNRIGQAVAMARDHGFTNFNLDLMFGLPTATLEDLAYSLEKALSLNPTHLSTYALTIEPNTPFKRQRKTTLDSDTAHRHFCFIQKTLKSHGFKHYEVSAFAKPGFTCQHNLTYWSLEPFIGIGPSGASFFQNRHYQCTTNLDQYLQNPTPPLFRRQIRPLSAATLFKDFLLTNLRRPEGISRAKIIRRFGHLPLISLTHKLDKLQALGLLRRNPSRLQVTQKGLLLLDSALLELLE